jgi:hypothetical protein
MEDAATDLVLLLNAPHGSDEAEPSVNQPIAEDLAEVVQAVCRHENPKRHSWHAHHLMSSLTEMAAFILSGKRTPR